MWLRLDKTSLLRMQVRKGDIEIEIPKPRDYWRLVTPDTLPARRNTERWGADLGIDPHDKVLRLLIENEAFAHMLVGGATRSGKTTLMKTILWGITRGRRSGDAVILLIDVAKRALGWHSFANIENMLHAPITDIDTAATAVRWLQRQICRRSTQGGRNDEPRIFVFADEIQVLMAQLPADGKRAINDIVALGGEVGIHLIAATQNPTQAAIANDTTIRRNITTRACGHVESDAAGSIVLGQKKSGADRLHGYGDFLVKPPMQSELIRMAAMSVPNTFVTALPRRSNYLLRLNGTRQAQKRNSARVRTGDRSGGGGEATEKRLPTPVEVATIIAHQVKTGQARGINAIQRDAQCGASTARRFRTYAEGVSESLQQQGIALIASPKTAG